MPGSASKIRAGSIFVELALRGEQFLKGLDAAEARLRKFADKINSTGKELAKIGAVMTAPFIAGAAAFSRFGDAVAKAARRLNMTAESLSVLQFAAGQSGSSIEDVETGIRSLTRVVGEAASGSAEASDALARIGLSAADLIGLRADEQIAVVADALQQIKDPTLRSSAAIELFGRSALKLLPLLEGGSAGLAEFQREAERLGIVLTSEQAAAAEQLNDAWGRLVAQARMMAMQIGAALTPALLDLGKWISEAAAKVIAWIKQNQALIVTVAKISATVLVAGVALRTLGAVIKSTVEIYKTLRSAVMLAVQAMGFLVAHPAIGGLIAVGAALGIIAAKAAFAADNTERAANAARDLIASAAVARSADLLRFERLGQLAEIELTPEGIAEAQRLINQLTERYGDLGLRVDEATRRVEGFEDAQRRANAAMAQRALQTAQTQLSALQAEQQALQRESAELLTTVGGRARDVFSGRSVKIGEELADLDERVRKTIATIVQLQRAIADLRAGRIEAVPEELLKGQLVPRDEDVLEQQIEQHRRAREQLLRDAESAEQQLAALDERRLDRLRTTLEREIAMLQREAKEREALINKIIEGEKAKGALADAARIRQLEAERDRTRDLLQQDIARARQREEEEQRRQRQQEEQQRLRAEQSLLDEVEDLRIRTEKDGMEERLALLEAERKRALRQAEEEGIDLQLVEEKFALMRRLLEDEARVGPQVQGTAVFGAEAAQAIGAGTTIDKQLAVLEQIDGKLQQLIEVERQAIPAFG